MNNYYTYSLILFFSLATIGLQAQITLTSSANGFEIGDNYIYNQVDPTTFDPGSMGANVTWDFSDIVTTSSNTTDIVDPATLDNNNLFPAANIGAIDPAGEVEGYYSLTSEAFRFLGVYSDINGFEVIINYSDPEDLIRFPMTFGDSYTDSFEATISSTGDFDRIGSKTAIATAYGTVITPAGTFENVLRIKEELSYVDELNGSPIFSYEETRYRWFDAFSGAAVLEYSEIFVDGNSSGSALSYLDAAPTVNTASPVASSIGLNVFPNPTADQITVDYSLTEAQNMQISVCNLLGKDVMTLLSAEQASGTYQLNADLSDLPNGTYFVKIMKGDEMGLHKIQVLK